MLGTSPARSTTSPEPVRRSIDETYRHYRLIAGQRGEGFSAVAYAGKVRVFAVSGSDLDAALDDLKMQIDRDFEGRVRERDGDQPSSGELSLALALASHKITGPLQHLLESLQEGPELSLAQVERRSGADRDTVLRDLVRLSRTLADILGVTLPKGSGSASAALDLVTESMDPAVAEDNTWTFRTAFAEAAQDHLAR